MAKKTKARQRKGKSLDDDDGVAAAGAANSGAEWLSEEHTIADDSLSTFSSHFEEDITGT